MMISVPVCPFCGCELRLQKAFGGYAYGGNHADDCYVGMVKIFDSEKAAYAAAMKRVEPMQKPLTVEEAQNQTTDIEDCFPVWVESNRQDVLAVALDRWDSNWKSYGKNWRCWLRKPTDEERAKAACEEQPND